MDQTNMYSPSFEYINPDRNKRKIKTFVIAGVMLGGLACYALVNVWLYRLGQLTANTASSTTIINKIQGYVPSSSPDVLGESQTRDPSFGTSQKNSSQPPPQSSTFQSIKKVMTTACDPSGKCNNYSNPTAAGCPVAFTDTTCNNLCSDPAKRCRDY